MLRSVRETIAAGLVVLFLGTAVYTLLGLAWTFKAAVETAQKIRHPFAGSV